MSRRRPCTAGTSRTAGPAADDDAERREPRPRDTVGAHCYGENEHSIGVNIVGNFEEAWPTDAQIDAAERLVTRLCMLYGIQPGEDTIKGHRDFNRTACPGQHFYDMLPDVVADVQARYHM